MASADAVKELLEKMASEREDLIRQAEAMTETEAEYAPPDGEGEAAWSAKQQLAHLAEMETAYRAWVEAALREDDPDVSTVRPERPPIRLDDAQGNSIDRLITQLRDQRAVTTRLIESLTPEQFERTARQAMFGRLTVMQWLRSYYRHDRMHRDQMAGKEPEYKPKFVGGKEPDQRRGPRV
jgi:hypothetical protein